jgi:hypothetical protein
VFSLALTKLTTTLNKISTLANRIRGQAATVKAAFDYDVNVVKTFINETLTAEIDVLDAANVKKTGNQTIAGVKTFSSSPVVPAPTNSTDATNKTYIDTNFTTKSEITTNRKLSASGDFTGSWHGITNPVYADPGIANVLSSHMAEYVPYINPTSTIASHRLMRFLNYKSDSDYTNVQGFCYHGGFYYVVYRYYMGDTTSNTCKIVKINASTGEIILTNELTLYHGNSLAYDSDNDILYVAGGMESETHVLSNALISVNPTTLEIISTDVLSIDFYQVAYDVDNHRLAVGYDEYVYILDSEYEVVSTIELNIPSAYYGTAQDMTIFENRIWILRHFPTAVYTYDFDGKLRQINALDLFADRLYLIGEVEGIDFNHDTGDCFISTGSKLNSETECEVLQILSTNFRVGTVLNRSILLYNVSDPMTFYVDATATGINPDGSAENPFADVQEAVNIFKSPYISQAYINIYDGDYSSVVMNKITTAIIFNAMESNVKIAGFKISGCKAILKGIKISDYCDSNGYIALYDGAKVTCGDVNIDAVNVPDHNVFASFSECEIFGTTNLMTSALDIYAYQSTIVCAQSATAKNNITVDGYRASVSPYKLISNVVTKIGSAITLPDDITYYNYMEIYGHVAGKMVMQRFPIIDGVINFDAVNVFTGSDGALLCELNMNLNLTAKTLTLTSGRQYAIPAGTFTTYNTAQNDKFYIDRVLLYK